MELFRRPAVLVAVPVLALGLWWLGRRPSSHRSWSPDHAVMPWAELNGQSVTVHEVRAFRWTGPAAFTSAYEVRTYDLDRIASAWFVLVPFSESWRGPAHSFVSFGFDDSSYVAISVEARREVGEEYSVLGGLFRRFELIYVVGEERDLIGRRAVYDGTDVYLYPIRAPPERIREVFVSMLLRANHLRRRPEFYNTLTNNCTSNLIRHVNQVVPGRIPPSWKTILPGYSDEVALQLGLIDSSFTLEAARAHYRINDRARAALERPEFSKLIREGF